MSAPGSTWELTPTHPAPKRATLRQTHTRRRWTCWLRVVVRLVNDLAFSGGAKHRPSATPCYAAPSPRRSFCTDPHPFDLPSALYDPEASDVEIDSSGLHAVCFRLVVVRPIERHDAYRNVLIRFLRFTRISAARHVGGRDRQLTE